MPVCAISDFTTGHPESMAKVRAFKNVQWLCGHKASYIAACIIILLQAIGVFISFNV